MEEVYLSSSINGKPTNPASEDIQMEIRDILMSPAAIVLNGLNDVNIENPTNGQGLVYNTTTQKWENTVPSGTVGYTDRGDPSSWDFSKADFTTDGQWHVLNLAGIVPEGTTLVHIAVRAASAYNDQTIVFVKNGSVNKLNGLTIRVLHGSNKEYFKSGWVACDNERKIEYWASLITWQTLDILVRGWM